jgi:hypothetical protein
MAVTAARRPRPLSASVEDILHVYVYAQRVLIQCDPWTCAINDRTFTLACPPATATELLIKGIADLLETRLYVGGQVVDRGNGETLIMLACKKVTPREGAFTSVGELKAITLSMHTVTWRVHGESLWNADVRWMLIRDAVFWCLETYKGYVMYVSLDEYEDFGSYECLYRLEIGDDTGLCWHWRCSKLRRFVLYGTAMADDPVDSVQFTYKDLERYMLGCADVFLSWHMGTEIVVKTRSKFEVQSETGLSKGIAAAMTEMCILAAASWSTAVIAVHTHLQQTSVFVCENIVLATVAALELKTVFTMYTWMVHDKPLMLQEIVESAKHLRVFSCIGVVDLNEDWMKKTFNDVVMPYMEQAKTPPVLEHHGQCTLLRFKMK